MGEDVQDLFDEPWGTPVSSSGRLSTLSFSNSCAKLHLKLTTSIMVMENNLHSLQRYIIMYIKVP